VFCAIVSHPADTIVSKLNQQKGSSISEVARKLGFMGKKEVLLSIAISVRDMDSSSPNTVESSFSKFYGILLVCTVR